MMVRLPDFLESQAFRDITTRLPDLGAGLFETVRKTRDGRVKAEDFVVALFPSASEADVARMMKLLRRPSPTEMASSVALSDEHRLVLLQVFKAFDSDNTGVVDIKDVLAKMPYDVTDNVSGTDVDRWYTERRVDPSKPLDFAGFCRLMRDVIA